MAAAAQVVLTLPGIVQSYDPVFNVAEVQPAVIAEDATADPSPITATVRFFGANGLGLKVAPVAGDHVTLIGHGLDATQFLAMAPLGGVARADCPGAGLTWEAWPAAYGPPGALIPGLWIGNLLGTSGVCVTEAGVALGTPAADAPLVRGTELVVWMGLLATALAAAPGGAITMPPIPPTLLSALAKVT